MFLHANYDGYDGLKNGRVFLSPMVGTTGTPGYESEDSRSEQNTGRLSSIVHQHLCEYLLIYQF